MGLSGQNSVSQIKDALEKMKDDGKYFSYAPIVWDGLSSGEREQLNQLLHQGPVFDGNVMSKSARDTLLHYGLAVRCCYLGEQGYTAASYLGYSVFRAGKAPPMKIIAPARG